MVGGTLSNGTAWTTIPIAFATATRGVFNLVQQTVANFPLWSTQSAYAVTGDFNGDSLADIALTGPAGWLTVPIAYSQGNGKFLVTNFGYGDFPGWAATPGVRVTAGDFDGDGIADIVLLGGAGWTTAPHLFPLGTDGSYGLNNEDASRPNADGSTLESYIDQSQNIYAVGTSNAYRVGGP